MSPCVVEQTLVQDTFESRLFVKADQENQETKNVIRSDEDAVTTYYTHVRDGKRGTVPNLCTSWEGHNLQTALLLSFHTTDLFECRSTLIQRQIG